MSKRNNDKYSLFKDDDQEQQSSNESLQPSASSSSQGSSNDNFDKIFEAVDYLQNIVPQLANIKKSLDNYKTSTLTEIKAGVDSYVKGAEERAKTEIDQATKQSVEAVKLHANEVEKMVEKAKEQLSENITQAIAKADIEGRVEKATGKPYVEALVLRWILIITGVAALIGGVARLYFYLADEFGGDPLRNAVLGICGIILVFYLGFCLGQQHSNKLF